MCVSLLAASSPAEATDIDRRKGLGVAQAIGGPAGLSFSFGVGNLCIESILGLSRSSFADDQPEPITVFTGGLGVHFFLLSAQSAALTVGARFNLGTGSANVQVNDGTNTRQQVDRRDITQFGFDVPLRIYWFPTRHISLHTEFGIAVFMGPEDALIFKADDGDVSLAPEGLTIVAFRNTSSFGQLGFTYWW